MTTTNTYGRQVVVPLTNKSGGSVAAGDVVIVDTANNDAFTTTTTAGFTGGIGIAQETIASNAVGRILTSGYAALVNTSASVTRGDFGKTHTVAKQAVDAGAARIAGTFCQFLTGGTTPDAIVYSPDLAAAALTDPMTTRGDIIVRDSSNTTARLGKGAAGKFLTSDGTDVAYGQGPLTTTGDLMIGATGGTPTRLAAGSTSGHVLTSTGAGAAPSWQAATGASITPATTEINTSEARAVNSFGDLTTAGPSVTVTVGASGIVLVLWASEGGANGAVGIVVSGANTVAANTNDILYWNTGPFDYGTQKLFTGLAAGSTTFKMTYRSFSGSATFANRRLTVIPF